MKNLPLLALASLLAMTVQAQTSGSGSHDTHHPATGATEAALTPAEGEVRKIDKAAKKITLKHGEIKNLDMTPMSMVFQVRDAALLDKVKAGDQVRFTADKVNGAYTVMTIEKIR